MSPDARQLIAQHARTTQLLGVDFLPLGTAPEGLGTEQAAGSVEPKPTPQPITPQPRASQPAPAAPPSADEVSRIPAVPLAELRAQSDAISGAQPRLDALRARYEQDAPHQHFNNSFTNIVFGEGAADADLMFVGEAPGEQEDQTGRPFVGRAGQLLEKMIVAMGYSRESVYICNVLKTRP
ncbi:MAG: uracil-DNA glycosylase, partial [Phycisphaerales bacterium]